jgi:RNA polymerase sigma factor (sigma-70 family)
MTRMRDLPSPADETPASSERVLPCVEMARVSEAREPFAEIYHGHAPLMRFIASRDFRVPLADAESIVHDIFMRYFSNPEVVRGDLKPYFRGAVRNGCLEYWKKRKREDSVFGDAGDAAAERVIDETSLADTVAVRLAVTETLARLRPRCSDALRRFHFEGKSMEVIAEELDVAPSYVRQLLSHAFLCEYHHTRVPDTKLSVHQLMPDEWFYFFEASLLPAAFARISLLLCALSTRNGLDVLFNTSSK